MHKPLTASYPVPLPGGLLGLLGDVWDDGHVGEVDPELGQEGGHAEKEKIKLSHHMSRKKIVKSHADKRRRN